jgi:hypothetical protein
MRRLLLLAIFGLALGAGGLAAPGCVVACSCAQPGDLATYRTDDTVIAIGRTGVRVGNDVPFTVERWFWGPGVAPIVPLVPADVRYPDGTTSFNTCGVALPAGQHLLMVAGRDPADGRLHPNICSPLVDVDTPEGQVLLAEAVATFGDGVVPTATEPTEPPAGDALPMAVAVVAVAIGVVALLGVVLIVGRRQPG